MEFETLMKLLKHFLIFMIFVSAVILCFGDGDREVAQDQVLVKSTGYWIYNDLDKGIVQAEKTEQPLLVVFR